MNVDPVAHAQVLAAALAEEERKHQKTRERAARLEAELADCTRDCRRVNQQYDQALDLLMKIVAARDEQGNSLTDEISAFLNT